MSSNNTHDHSLSEQQWKLVKEFIKTCDTCSCSKVSHHLPYGLLQPLLIPGQQWVSISTDFITNLPSTEFGFASVLVVVDRFTKMTHFILCSKVISRIEISDRILMNVVRLHGLLNDIISNCGSQYIRISRNAFSPTLGTSMKLSLAFYPRTDGQTKRVNQILKQYLQCMISYQQDD